jgi:hypothetical protein
MIPRGPKKKEEGTVRCLLQSSIVGFNLKMKYQNCAQMGTMATIIFELLMEPIKRPLPALRVQGRFKY